MSPDSIAIPGAQTLVGGAPVNIQTLDRALTLAPRLVAVDGGANTCLSSKKAPDIVVGDLDSISEEARIAYASILHHVAEQDSTDFTKALCHYPAPISIAVGFLGARTDHLLACLSALADGRMPCILVDETDCLCIAPRSAQMDLPQGTRFSFWPLGPSRAMSDGLRWPLDGIEFGPAGRVGTSNEVTGPVTWRIEGGPMVLILPAEHLEAMVTMLNKAPREPERASV